MAAGAALDPLSNGFHFLGLQVVLSQNVRECHMYLGQMLEGLISFLILEQDQDDSELTLCGLSIALAEFDLEEFNITRKCSCAFS